MTILKQFFTSMRTFTIIWIGQLISTLGSGLTGFALGVWIYEQTGSPTLFAINLFIYFLPRVIGSPLAGVLADRFDRRVVMLASDSLAALATLVIALLYFSAQLQIWHVYMATAIFAIANTLQWPAYSAATTLLVPKEHLGRAGGMTQVGDAISSLVSPGVAGILYVATGLKTIMIIDLVTYLFALGTLITVRFPKPEKPKHDEAFTFFQDMLVGWRFIVKRKGFLALQIIFAIMNFCGSVTYAMFTPMILEIAEPNVLGLIASILGGGFLVGTLILSIWGGPKRRIFGTYIFESLFGVSLFLTGWATTVPWIVAAQLLGTISVAISNGCTQAMWQSKVPHEMQGRVFSARPMISFSIIPLAYLVSGPLSEKFFIPAMVEGGTIAARYGHFLGVGADRGIGLMYILFGLIYILAGQAIVLYPRLRRIELELPDAITEPEAATSPA
jgi:DHA3 family macrolide efflux protein-like MFS transporter